MKLTDSNNLSWSLMSIKDSSGCVYIIAYRNRWDPIKKRSSVGSKLQVGRLQADGSVTLSKKFLVAFPAFADLTWYWGDHELLSESEFLDQFPNKPEVKDISWSNENIRFGVTWAAWQIAERMGIFDDLSSVFGEKNARTLLALSLYKLDGGGAMMNFEDWVTQVWLPKVASLESQRLSEVLQSIDQRLIDDYYKRRYDRAQKRSTSSVTLSFDSTSISTYSNTIEDAAWGHANGKSRRQHGINRENLRFSVRNSAPI